MLLPKKLSKSTGFKAMALPPAGDELLGSLRQWKALVLSCLVTVCQHKTKTLAFDVPRSPMPTDVCQVAGEFDVLGVPLKIQRTLA